MKHRGISLFAALVCTAALAVDVDRSHWGWVVFFGVMTIVQWVWLTIDYAKGRL